MVSLARCSRPSPPIQLRANAFPLGDFSKFWESAKSAGEDFRVEGRRILLINRAARKNSPFRPSSYDVVKPLSTYGLLPFRLRILRSLQEILLRVTLCGRDVQASAADRALLN
ncbi:hypothetical protein DPMN_001597 [Dreissena polymorpha]|uniref:Uncharacterized protein n=1 Tax=Dreissena polymorpha TaxID=45954 RepID=A0A9D4MLN1_DREPO|nr:hypothetical protein DPMN_001597 [Dreissena polymorpha]